MKSNIVIQDNGTAVTESLLEWEKKYPGSIERSQKVMDKLRERDAKPKSAGGWKRNYSKGNQNVQTVRVARGAPVAGTGKPGGE